MIAMRILTFSLILLASTATAWSQVAVRGERIYTMAGAVIEDGVVLIRDGKITSIGRAADVNIPADFEVLEAAVVTPGLVDAHTTVGFSGLLNIPHDQDQLERSEPVQPELRAVDAFNVRDDLIEWVRSFGVTTIHAGHAPGELVSGQTLIAKTRGNSVDDSVIVPARAIAVTLSPLAQRDGGKAPGTRGKMLAMLRAELIKAREYRAKQERAPDDGDPVPVELRTEAFAAVLDGKLPLLLTADRAQDIASALRLASEFKIRIWLDSAAEAYLLMDEIKQADVPVILHPTMSRASGDRENLSYATAARLMEAGIPVAIQSGYEAYVPKTRVVLFEAGYAAAHGLSFEQALASITCNAAKLLGVDDRVGSLEVGKDGDIALYDGDPFEYTTHCIGVVIEGVVVSRRER